MEYYQYLETDFSNFVYDFSDRITYVNAYVQRQKNKAHDTLLANNDKTQMKL